MSVLELNGVSKTFHSKKSSLEVIKNVSLKVEENEIVCLVGPSGGGKSTILNMIAGLIIPDQGIIKKSGKIGYMFQHDLLFEWRTIKKNLTLGLELDHKIIKDDEEKVINYLKKYDLLDFINSHPSELSGGMRQRIALIRTLLINPNLLLLDEPFSALDAQTRIKISDDIYKMIKNEHLSAILVTHDIAEAISLGDRVIVLTKRPASVYKEYKLNFKEVSPLKKRSEVIFNSYFSMIWRDLCEQ